MKEETVKEVLDALKRGFQLFIEATGQKASDEEFEKSQEIAMKILAGNPNHKHDADVVAKHGWNKFLLSQPEPSPEEKEKYLTILRNLPILLRQPLIDLGKKLPHQRKGTRPAFGGSQQKERKACEEVGLLIGGGYVELPDALARVARKNHISARTMRRAWNRYKAQQVQKSIALRSPGQSR